MNLPSIYQKYKTPPIIQRHQLRVASVARAIALAQTWACDVELVTQVGLLHDMGNIIKIQFRLFPEVWEPEGIEYWKGVQQEYLEKWSHEHEATMAIARELALPDAVLTCLDAMSFSHMEEVLERGTLEAKICHYADMRVGPFGILSLHERLEEAKRRYEGRTDRVFDSERHAAVLRLAEAIECDIFTGISLKPEDITDAQCAPIVEQLSCYTFGPNGDHR